MRLPERELIVILRKKNHLFIRKESKKSITQKMEKKAHFMSIDEMAEKILVMFNGNMITAHEVLKVMEL